MSLGRRVARAARHAWASPCSLVGLVAVALVLALGGRVRRVAGTLEASWHAGAPGPGSWADRMPFRAVALGHVIVAVSADDLARSRRHERAHVRQYERWGLFFFPAYALSGAWQWLNGRRAYWDNHFEVDARRRSRPGPG